MTDTRLDSDPSVGSINIQYVGEVGHIQHDSSLIGDGAALKMDP